jgi:hypothetical protein
MAARLCTSKVRSRTTGRVRRCRRRGRCPQHPQTAVAPSDLHIINQPLTQLTLDVGLEPVQFITPRVLL